ncbi:MAG TPA: Crp/Fnr family transcriptional regulator [Aquaticitalea sp.]|nr:Crp/Fnr family transcriptional regulator [Aquaticitalea sp.]
MYQKFKHHKTDDLLAPMISDILKRTFEPGLIEEIKTKGKKLSLKDGDVILDVGQTIKLIPILLKGSLKVSRIDENGNELLLYYINSNESCAMTFTCCMEQYPSEIRVTAEGDVELVSIPVSVMDEWMGKFGTWKNFVMKTIRSRFKELLETIDQIAFQKLDERLVHYLKEKSKATGSSLINMSHEQIANEMASSREVISRLLKKLENNKKVILYRNQIKLMKEL